MTLHWWMHWFWITRTVAAVTVLLLVLSAGTAAPLPLSTLHPDVQTGPHFSSAPGSNWASALPLDYQEKVSSVSSGPSEEVPFGASPVWTSSPEIEEPSDPTTVLSSGLSSVDIPGNSHAISWFPPTHRQVPGTGEEHLRVFNVVDPNGEESIPWTDSNGPDVLTEPRALPLEVAPLTLRENENHTIPIHPSIRNIPPKNLKNDSVKITNILSKDTRNQSQTDNTLSSKNDFALDPNNEPSGSEYVARLIPRDLRNASEAELSSEVTSHRNSSTQPEVYKSNFSQEVTHINVRTSKSIGFFPPQTINSHLLPKPASIKEPELGDEHLKRSNGDAGQDSGEKREGGSDGKTLSESSGSKQLARSSGDSVNVKLSVNKGSVDNVGTKMFPEDLEMSDSPYAPEEHFNSSAHGTQGHVRVLKQTSANSSESVEDKKTDFESGNSKIPSDNHTKLNANLSDSSVNVSDSTVGDKTHGNNKGKDSTPVTSTVKSGNGTAQNKKSINGTQILNQTLPSRNGDNTGVPNQEGNSSSANNSRDSVTYPSSSGVPITSAVNVTSTSNRADFGRAASHNYADEDDTTSTISVTPVSRVAALPSSGSRKGLDAASITGIALGIVVFAGLTGAVSFVLYRRRYLNKPQTLNDKCSNPDSSGYIDDSTLRENSEEMYSLDNDSFLNSLEAMTIQNYWTDNVKHTKL